MKVRAEEGLKGRIDKKIYWVPKGLPDAHHTPKLNCAGPAFPRSVLCVPGILSPVKYEQLPVDLDCLLFASLPVGAHVPGSGGTGNAEVPIPTWYQRFFWGSALILLQETGSCLVPSHSTAKIRQSGRLVTKWAHSCRRSLSFLRSVILPPSCFLPHHGSTLASIDLSFLPPYSRTLMSWHLAPFQLHSLATYTSKTNVLTAHSWLITP